MRPIDADKITDWMIDELRKQDGAFDSRNGREAANLIGKTIDEQPTIGGWNSVKDHPPEKDKDVIIYGKFIGSSGTEYPEMLITDIDDFVLNGYVPVAWMPLPELPKE